jgi:hypothetical protein
MKGTTYTGDAGPVGLAGEQLEALVDRRPAGLGRPEQDRIRALVDHGPVGPVASSTRDMRWGGTRSMQGVPRRVGAGELHDEEFLTNSRQALWRASDPAATRSPGLALPSIEVTGRTSARLRRQQLPIRHARTLDLATLLVGAVALHSPPTFAQMPARGQEARSRKRDWTKCCRGRMPHLLCILSKGDTSPYDPSSHLAAGLGSGRWKTRKVRGMSCAQSIVRHLHRMVAFLATGIAVLLATAPPAPAATQEGQSKECVAAALPSWTPQEIWVWKRLCGRGRPDLNSSRRFGPPADIDKPKSWSSKRVLRSSFLETILTDTHYSNLLPRREVTIAGAWFRSPIDLGYSSIPVTVNFVYSRLDQGINLAGTDISGTIGFIGSRVQHELILNGAKVGGSVLLSYGSKFGAVNLDGADVKLSVNAHDESTFTDELSINGAKIGGSVLLYGRSRFKSVDLVTAEVGQNVDAIYESTFTDGLKLDSAKVRGNVLLRDGSKFGVVDLESADIDGNVDAHNQSTFTDDLSLYSARVKGSVDLYGSHFASDVNFSGATIGGVLGLYGDHLPTWSDSSEINLEGSTFRAIDDAEGAWPKHVRLAGLVVQQAHGRLTAPGQGIIDRPTRWYHEWLSRDGEFSREFYKQLEGLLRNNGRIEAADEIAMTRMDHEYALAGPYRKVLGFFHHYVVGYGYHPEWSILWVISLIVIGALVARHLPEPVRDGIPSLLVLSAQRLIPLVDFGKTYSDVEVTGKNVPAGVRGYFYVHAIFGYVLAAFIIAAIARITTTY